MSREKKIGLVVLTVLGVVVLFGLTALISHQHRSLNYTILFEDAKGLSPGDRVQMNGVNIGVVEQVVLGDPSEKVRVGVQIDPEHAEKIQAHSTAIIRGVSMVNVSGQHDIEVINAPDTDSKTPPMKDDTVVEGQDSLLELKLWQLRQTVTEPGFFSEKAKSLRESAESLGDQIRDLAKDPEIRRTLDQLIQFMKQLRSASLEHLERLQREWPELRQRVQRMMQKLEQLGREQLAEQFRGLLEEINRLLEQMNQTPPEPQQPQPA